MTDDDALRREAARLAADPLDVAASREVLASLDDLRLVPEWMERYRPLVGETGGNSIETLLHRLRTEQRLIQVNLPVFVMSVAVQAQTDLLRRLHDQGLLP